MEHISPISQPPGPSTVLHSPPPQVDVIDVHLNFTREYGKKVVESRVTDNCCKALSFTLKRNTFHRLLEILRRHLQREDTRFRNCVTLEKVLAIGILIYGLAHGASF